MNALAEHLSPTDICLGDIELAIQNKYINPSLNEVITHANLPAFAKQLLKWIGGHKCVETEFSPLVKLKSDAYRRKVRAKSGIGSAHVSALEIKQAVGNEIWDSCFKFSFVRNPWDRMVSFYFWRTRGLTKKPSFEEFIEAIHELNTERIKKYNATGYDNYPIYTIDGEIAVDHLARFENLNEEVAYIYSKLCINPKTPLPKEKTNVRPKNISISHIHTPKTIDMIKKIFANEIDITGYEFIPN